jgi:hypothetical protein
MKKGSAKKGKRKNPVEHCDDRVGVDEVFGSDEIGLPAERYQPRPSLRRSKSVFMEAPDTGVNDPAKPTRGRKRSKQTTRDQIGFTSNDSELIKLDVAAADLARNSDSIQVQEGGPVEITGGPPRVRSIEETSKEVDAHPPIPTLSSQSKRTWKETSDLILNDSENVSEVHRPKTDPHASSHESVVMQEIDNNKVPPASTPSIYETPEAARNAIERTTPKPEEVIEPLPILTPKREAVKGPDQHSPLQSGKVPYRVGLSKKRRIAPLLKVIRKS